MGKLQGNPRGQLVAMTMISSLEAEWRHVARAPRTRAEMAALARAEPVLAFERAEDMVSAVVWHGYRTDGAGAAVLSALLRQAASPFAARALLQALLPRARAEKVATPTYGHGVGESWPRPSDTAADLVAECYAAIRRHAGQDSGRVDRLIVGEAARRLRTARQAQRRWQARTAEMPAWQRAGHEVALLGARSGAEWLAVALFQALRAGALGLGQARLLYAVRVEGLPASEAGRRYGLAGKAVYHALARAEAALVAASDRSPRVGRHGVASSGAAA